MGWSAKDIPDQTGRRALVTGANSGIGLRATVALARAGAEVLLACRDAGRGERALATVRAEVPAAQARVVSLDLADLASVRSLASDLDAEGAPLDLLVNNAGVMAIPHRTTADGFEMQLGTNVLGHFALTGLLLDRLLASAQPRVVTLSSQMHRIGKIDFDDLQSERKYRRWAAYGQSKLGDLLFARELQRRADAADAPLRSVAAHPGYSATNLQTAGPKMDGSRIAEVAMKAANLVVATSDDYGALPTLYAATHPEVPGGSFVGPTWLGQSRGPIGIVGSSRAGTDRDTARRLWDVAEDLTGVAYLAPAAAAA